MEYTGQERRAQDLGVDWRSQLFLEPGDQRIDYSWRPQANGFGP